MSAQPTQLTRYLTRDEEARFFRTLKAAAGSDTKQQLLARRDYHLHQLLRHTGIRVNALLHIRCADAHEALRTNYLQRRHDKGGRDGLTYCNKRARRALRGLLANRRALGHAEWPEALLITSRSGPSMTAKAVQEQMKTWCRRAGLGIAATPHWWRHTYAMRVMETTTSNDPRGVVQALLDHASIQSTLQYTRPTREQIEAAAEEAA